MTSDDPETQQTTEDIPAQATTTTDDPTAQATPSSQDESTMTTDDPTTQTTTSGSHADRTDQLNVTTEITTLGVTSSGSLPIAAFLNKTEGKVSPSTYSGRHTYVNFETSDNFLPVH